MPRYPLSLFFLAVLVVAIAAPVAHAGADADGSLVRPLEWRDTGFELKPGYMIHVEVEAKGTDLGGLAKGGVKLDAWDGSSWIVGIDKGGGDDVLVRIGPYTWKIGELGLRLRAYHASFTITLYCPGESPPGLDPVDGSLWLVIRESNLGVEKAFLVSDPGKGTVIDLKVYTEKHPVYRYSSRVDLGEAERIPGQSCRGYGGDLPRLPWDPSRDLSWLVPASVVGGLLIAGLAVLRGGKRV